MGRITQSFTIEGKLSAEISAEAKKRGISRSELMNVLVRESLERSYERERLETMKLNAGSTTAAILAIGALVVYYL